MTTSLRSHIADVLAESNFEWQLDNAGIDLADHQANALLADRTFKAIVDLAAQHDKRFIVSDLSPEVRALLKAHRESRAEQEPER